MIVVGLQRHSSGRSCILLLVFMIAIFLGHFDFCLALRHLRRSELAFSLSRSSLSRSQTFFCQTVRMRYDGETMPYLVHEFENVKRN